ncbi:hypothetical protein M434DRAFT_402696 [Hypoxylon sp. CO27-5]|nr:hypothetical protein M434DRAFT_402696 [Hypoxylon sp. CO27-5]
MECNRLVKRILIDRAAVFVVHVAVTSLFSSKDIGERGVDVPGRCQKTGSPQGMAKTPIASPKTTPSKPSEYSRDGTVASTTVLGGSPPHALKLWARKLQMSIARDLLREPRDLPTSCAL